MFIFGQFLAAERLQRWLDGGAQKPIILPASLLGLGLIAFDQRQDGRIWVITNRVQNFWIYFDRLKWYVKNNYTDTLYIGLVFGSLAISLVSIIVLSIVSWKVYRIKTHSA